MPSSLTRVLSSALGYSPHLPESVYGTVSQFSMRFEAFPGSLELSTQTYLRISSPPSRRCNCVLFLQLPPTGFHQLFHSLAGLSFSVTPPLQLTGTGLLTRSPSLTPFGLSLGPAYPARITLAQETLGLRRPGFSPGLSLLMSAFSLPEPPNTLPSTLLRRRNAPLPIP